MRHLFTALLLASSGAVLAQPPPAPDTPSEQPALQAAPEVPVAAPRAAGPKPQEEGTTIVGERESPIGLFITPWRNASAEQDIDRPARLLQEELLPIDEQVFVRQVEYYEALSGALRRKNVVTPQVGGSAAPAPATTSPAVAP